jgi:hypothetical protein
MMRLTPEVGDLRRTAPPVPSFMDAIGAQNKELTPPPVERPGQPIPIRESHEPLVKAVIAPEPVKAMRKPPGLTFSRHGEITLADDSNSTASGVSHSLALAGSDLRKIRAFVGTNPSVTVEKLKDTFSNAYVITSGGADDTDLREWIDIFKPGPERATAKNAALVWGEKKTGLTRTTLKTYASKGSKERKKK